MRVDKSSLITRLVELAEPDQLLIRGRFAEDHQHAVVFRVERFGRDFKITPCLPFYSDPVWVFTGIEKEGQVLTLSQTILLFQEACAKPYTIIVKSVSQPCVPQVRTPALEETPPSPEPQKVEVA